MMRHRPDVSDLARTPLFANYTPRELAPLVPHVDRLVVLPGATLAAEGRHPHEILVILSGEVAEAGEHWDGSDVGGLGAGGVIGAREELDGTAHATTLVARTAVDTLVITGAAFRWAVQSLPGFSAYRDAAA
jgi:CRP-like cAMP-binding protein